MPVYGNILDGQQLLDLLNTGSSRQLRDSGDYLSLDWENGDVYFENTAVLQWKYGDMFDSNGYWSLDWWERLLVDASSQRSIDWQNRSLIDDSGLSVIDWGYRQLRDSAGNSVLDWSTPGDIRFNWRNLLEINSIDVNGELQGGAGNGITINGFHFRNSPYPLLDTNGNFIANGDSSYSSLLQGTSWNTGGFILGNDNVRGDGYIRAANFYVDAQYLSFFGVSPSSQQSSYSDVNNGASSNFWNDYGNDAVLLEDTAGAVNYCLYVLRTYGLIAP
jgi:hypothetical protein